MYMKDIIGHYFDLKARQRTARGANDFYKQNCLYRVTNVRVKKLDGVITSAVKLLAIVCKVELGTRQTVTRKVFFVIWVLDVFAVSRLSP